MEVFVFAAADGDALADALEAEGLEARARALPSGDGNRPSAALVSALRAAEEALAADPPAAVLVKGADDAALAVALTAVKLQIPTGWLAEDDSVEGALIGRVADASVDASAPAGEVASQVSELAARRLPAP